MYYYLLTLSIIPGRSSLCLVPGDSRREGIDRAGLPVILYGRNGWDLCQVSPAIIANEDRCTAAELPKLIERRRAEIGHDAAMCDSEKPYLISLRPERSVPAPVLEEAAAERLNA